MPRGGDGLRRPGGTRREEQRRQVPGFARCGVRWARRCACHHVGQRIPNDQNRLHGLHAVDDLEKPRMTFGVGDDDLGARQPQRMHKKVVLVRDIHRGGHRTDPRRAQPDVHPLRAGRREQRDGVAPADADADQRVCGRARPIPHLLERHRCSGDRHQQPVRILVGAPIQHGRDREVLDTELRRTYRPVRSAGFRHPPPPGPVHRRRCNRSRSATALRLGRTGAPSVEARHSRGLPRAPNWASPGTSCSPR